MIFTDFGVLSPTARERLLKTIHSVLKKGGTFILFQHIIIDAEENIETYRFWTHFFSQNNIGKMLDAHNFVDISFREDILPEGYMWNGDNVIFAKASK